MTVKGVEAEEAGFVATFETKTPVSQTNFLPDFMQVNFLSDVIDLEPSFRQVVPALTPAFAGVEIAAPIQDSETTRARIFFMGKMVLSPHGCVSSYRPQFFSYLILISSLDISSA